MQVSESIIAVLDALCEKIGIAVDWTGANILPSVQTLMGKCVAMELWTSVLWSVVFLLPVIVVWRPYQQKPWYTNLPEKDVFATDQRDMRLLVFWVRYIVTVLCGSLVIFQLVDIITCLTFPEKILLNMARPYLR